MRKFAYGGVIRCSSGQSFRKIEKVSSNVLGGGVEWFRTGRHLDVVNAFRWDFLTMSIKLTYDKPGDEYLRTNVV